MNKGQSALTDQKCNIRAIASALTEAFGDRRNECKAVVLHSEHYKDIETDEKSGFLKADANDPFYKIKGFVGRSSFLFNLAFLSMMVFQQELISQLQIVRQRRKPIRHTIWL